MPLDRCLNFHNLTAGSWDSPSCPLIGQYWPLLWRHRSLKYAQLATTRSLLWYFCLFNSILLGRFVLRDKQLAIVWLKISTFWPCLTFLWRHRSKNKVNIIVSCRVRRDTPFQFLLYDSYFWRYGGGPLGHSPSGRVTRQTPSLARVNPRPVRGGWCNPPWVFLSWTPHRLGNRAEIFHS